MIIVVCVCVGMYLKWGGGGGGQGQLAFHAKAHTLEIRQLNRH